MNLKALFLVAAVSSVAGSLPDVLGRSSHWIWKPVVRGGSEPAKDKAVKLSAVLREASERRHAAVPVRAVLQSSPDSTRVVCYYTNWAQYRQGAGKYTPANAVSSAPLCTHIHYAFAKIAQGKLAPYEWNDPDHDGHKGNFRKVTDLKQANPSLKVLLSVGGWNMNSQPFSQMVRTKQSRKKFILSAVKLLQKYNFDGLDVDWEYPTKRNAKVPEDRHRYTLLLKETVRTFRAYSRRNPRVGGCKEEKEEIKGSKGTLMLTAALPAGEKNMKGSYEVNQIHKYLDYAVLMSYDFHGSWDNVTGENSPLYNAKDDPGMSVNASAAMWTSQGFPAEKLVVGVASYGRSFTLKSASASGLKAPVTGAGIAQQFTRLRGMASYYEVCRIIKSGGKVTQLVEQDVPYVVKQRLWVGYDDQKSFRDKVAFAKNNRMGGVGLWSLDLDDFSGTFCGEGPHPLLSML